MSTLLSGKSTANPASGDYLIGVDVSASDGIRKFILSDDWRFGKVGIGVAPTEKFHVVGSGVANKDVYVGHTLSNGSGLATGAVYRPFQLDVVLNATDLDNTTVASLGINSTYSFGLGAAASIGKMHAFSGSGVISGCGDQLSEYAAHFAAIRFDIGTGYTQTAGPAGRGWLTDWNIHGPIAVQPHLLNGITLLYNNHYNGSPASSSGAGIWLVTRKGQGGGTDATHIAADTYPADVGLGIVGTSDVGGTEGVGWTKGIQIGGNGSAWKIAGSSRIGTGIDISDHFSYGIRIRTRHASGTAPALVIDADAGPLIIGAQSLVHSTALLEVVGASTADPLAYFGSSAGSLNQSVRIRSGNGSMNLFASGSAGGFLTSTASGDVGIQVVTTGKMFHIGGTVKIITVTRDDKLGFFAVTPVARPLVATGAGKTVDNVITELQNLGLFRQS